MKSLFCEQFLFGLAEGSLEMLLSNAKIDLLLDMIVSMKGTRFGSPLLKLKELVLLSNTKIDLHVLGYDSKCERAELSCKWIDTRMICLDYI